MEVIVAKFGGSSLADAKQFEKAASIVHSDKRRRIIVVSAPGKRHEKDEKITDLLISCHSHVASGLEFRQIFAQIRARFCAIAEEMGIARNIDSALDEVENQLAYGTDLNTIVSRGEYLNARLFADYLDFDFIDAVELIEFSSASKVNIEATKTRIDNRIKDGRYVIPGFYGVSPAGQIELFTRGGSDITASFIARNTGADVYENWTDVSGLFRADPDIVENPQPIETMSYRELQELSYLGACVFHEEAVTPVRQQGIPINIRNTDNPHHPGTMITLDWKPSKPVTGIAGRTGCRFIYAEEAVGSNGMQVTGELSRILSKYTLPPIYTSKGCNSFSTLVLDKEGIDWELLTAEIHQTLPTCHIDAQVLAAVVGVAGFNISRNCEVISLALREFSARGIPMLAIRGDYSPHSVMFVVAQKLYKETITILYDAVIEQK